MQSRLTLLVVSVLLAIISWQAGAAAQDAAPADSRAVQTLAEKARPSMAAFRVTDRDGKMQGMGTGFVLSADGLIATNLHVIGEGRGFVVELADGRELKVVEVFAADRHLDLAIVRVETGDEKLPALELGQAGQLQPGAPIVVMGNPFGLKYSVVSGVLSARRDVEGRQMLQLAIPIEPGNSGSPVLDLDGRVQGVVTMKSAVTNNLGFAVDIADLRPLLEKPNPVPIDRWLSIGALDDAQWQPLFGAHWRQRAGRISVDGAGEGFGGRSLCLFQQPPPPPPYDVVVRVKLNDEAGAAGLVFHSDGQDRHYGFYPSNGNLRITCFQGPTVFSWEVLHDQASPHYQRDNWNLLRVRVEKDRFVCFVNEREVYASADIRLPTGKVGLAKFRDTQAEFRGFELAANANVNTPAEDQEERIAQLIGQLSPDKTAESEALEALAALAPASEQALRAEAKKLEQQAVALKRLAEDIHVHNVVTALSASTAQEEFDLLRGCLLVARLDDEDLDVEAYAREVDRMAEQIRRGLEEAAADSERLKALDRYLFQEHGFHGSRHEYYHRANSYLNRVVDDREGLPITLSVLYMALAERIGVTIEGVGLPGHFVVRYRPAEGEPQVIDVFNGGKRLTRDEVAAIVRDFAVESLDEQHLRTSTRREILERVIRNLLNVAQQQEDAQATRRYLEGLVALVPDSIQYRGMRAIARFQSGRAAAAIEDLDWFLEHEPPGVELDRIREMRAAFQQSPLWRAPD